MYVLNEETFVDEILETKQKPNGLSIPYLIKLLLKNVVNKNDTESTEKKEIIKEVLNILPDFKIQGYEEYVYYKLVEKSYSELFKDNNFEFKKIDYIPIYKSDINIVNTVQDVKLKKLIFTLIALARFANCDGWINKKDIQGISEVFKLANIACSSDERYNILNDLYVKKIISFAKSITNLNIQVMINQDVDDDEVVYKVANFDDLGNQYVVNFIDGYIACKLCGRVIKKTSNKKMYCNPCADKMAKENRNKYLKRVRETQK